MKSRPLPPVRLTPARDPLLEDPISARAWRIVRRWSPGLAFALALLVAQGKMAEWDARALADDQLRETANSRAELESLRNAHAHRVASGCATLFYLVQGDVGERLYQATQALDTERVKVLAKSSIPRGTR